MVFIDPSPSPSPAAAPPPEIKTKKHKKKPADNSLYVGKYIRNIEIITLDPFGMSVNDTSIVNVKKLQKAGNKLHIKSTRLTIKNQLLFGKGDKIDPLIIKETERILRESAYVRDAIIEIKPIKKSKDSVDVIIRVQDRWSITGSVSPGTSTSQFKVGEKNFLGLAHQIENNVSYNLKTGSGLTSNGSYSILYIKNTFITAKGYYSLTPGTNYRGISLNRQFYSPLTRWAGGVDMLRYNYASNFTLPDSSVKQLPLQYAQQDYWIGKSFRVKRKKTNEDERSAKFLATGRVFNLYYLERPPPFLDTLSIYQHSTLYLGSVGFSARKYYKDKYIFRFGEVEDVPEGRLLAVLGGIEQKEMLTTRYYTGITSSFGSHIEKLGYLSAGMEYGTFFRNGKAEKGVVNFHLTFFSDLWNIKKWKIRPFLYYRYIHGINREINESININSKKEMYGFDSPSLTGTDKMLLNLETVFYIPYDLLGFQFATVLFAGFGMVGDEQDPLLNNRIHQAYGLGLLIRNEYLVINTFRISFAIYPHIPGNENPVFKYNPVSSYNLRFQNFFLSKPDVIMYQ